MPELKKAFKSGFVAVVGRPNAGKSTLVNALVGAKVSIVTPVAQTTRNRILGIVHRPDAQVVLMDTPGIHRPLSRLNDQMMAFVREALEERDLTLLIADASAPFGTGDEFAVQLVAEHAPRAILLLNKIDRVHKPKLLPLIDRYSKLHNFEEIFLVSALKGMHLEEVLEGVVARLPDGPAYFPPDVYTDQPERFLAAEIVRERMIHNTRQELPHASAVLIESFEESETITRIHATILVERESQKPIVIGAHGSRIKQIGTEARQELEKVFPPKVFLQLFVRVEPGWRDSRPLIASLDYRNEG
ncbi:MAG: GTPase Era [Acidobacteria bacterium]|nr:MAG: GTPase Era [Acidobacteriota bacterium]